MRIFIALPRNEILPLGQQYDTNIWILFPPSPLWFFWRSWKNVIGAAYQNVVVHWHKKRKPLVVVGLSVSNHRLVLRDIYNVWFHLLLVHDGWITKSWTVDSICCYHNNDDAAKKKRATKQIWIVNLRLWISSVLYALVHCYSVARIFLFFFWKVTRTRNSAIAGKCIKKNQKNWRNLSLHSLQLLNHLKEFLFPPFFSLSRDIVAQVEKAKEARCFAPLQQRPLIQDDARNTKYNRHSDSIREKLSWPAHALSPGARADLNDASAGQKREERPRWVVWNRSQQGCCYFFRFFSPLLFSPYRRSCWTERKRNNSLISPLLPLDPSITGQISRISSRAVVPHPLLFADCLRIEHRLLPALLRRN